MRKRILFLLLLAFAFSGLKAQISYSGSLPTTIEAAGCLQDFEDLRLNSYDSYAYLTLIAGLTFEGDCGYSFNVDCQLSFEDVGSCYFYGKRTFTVTDTCGNSLVLPTQSVFVYYYDETFQGYHLPEETFFRQGSLFQGIITFDDVLPNTSDAVKLYLTSRGFEYPECWAGLPIEASYTTQFVGNQNDCYNEYDVRFVIEPSLCPQNIVLYQNVVVVPDLEEVYCSGTELEPLIVPGCEVRPNAGSITSVSDFAAYGVEIYNYLRECLFEISYEEDYDESNSTCADYIVNRTYTVTYPCTEQTFTLHQEVHFEPNFAVYGNLESEFYTDELPEPLSDAELRDKLDIHYSCGMENISTWSMDVTFEDNEYMIERWYIVEGECPEIVDSVSQYLFKTTIDPTAFKLVEKRDLTIEGARDGYAELARPSGLYCPSCTDQPEKMFRVEWHNQTTGEIWYGDIERDIFVNDSLTAGNYTVEVYPICPDFSMNPDEPIYTEDFKIKEEKMEVVIDPWMTLHSTHVYPSFFAHIYAKDDDGSIHIVFDPLDGGFNDEWELAEGLLYSPRIQEFTLDEMYNPHMGGFGAYENILDHYERFNYGALSNGLQQMIVAKDERSRLTYRLYKKRNRDEDLGILFKEVTKTLYSEELFCSKDPNEIFGPAGYTNADSTCVRMIGADADVAYTIMFENDPEFATAAAARVKVECPLSENIDPTTFRLGQFGFNNMTFEVPAMASYYNQRLQLDSLGYWLDVTASIQVPENVAYWIFQTIDPETGVAPIDSVGFLPVNDTLTGCGEGYVTFTASLAHNGTRSLQTGDVVVEKADIYFDENEVVPTNDYVNPIDAVAPTSRIVCDTTDAYLSQVLDIGFASGDDEGGSGVHHINLFANLDNRGYELVGEVHPDEVYSYPITNANMLQFFAQAADNVGNLEPLKLLPELVYTQGNPPLDLSLSNNHFEEDAVMAHEIGTFSTLDDQTSDDFSYALVAGDGASHNDLFSIVDNRLVTNNDFRCYGTYQYNVRVRTTDLSGLFYEKAFTLYASRTNEVAPVVVYESICEGEGIYFGNQYVDAAGLYEHTFESYLGCDSLVTMQVTVNPSNPAVEYDDVICSNYDYEGNGFNISAETLADMTGNWSHTNDTLLIFEQYNDNMYGCTDTTRLTLTLRPAYEMLDDYLVCPTDLPFVYQYRPYISDTTVVFNKTAINGCDSTVVFQLTINPNNGTQTDALATGWSWYSSYIDMSDGKGLQNLKNALGDEGITIKSQFHFLQYSPTIGQWTGNLDAIDNASAYMIQTRSPLDLGIFGCYADPAAVPMTLHNGWNWIGFPSIHSISLDDAFGDKPSDGDLVKSKTGFAMYYGSYGSWVGTLSELQPGHGYQYNSNNTSNVEFTYPSATRDADAPTPLPEVNWLANEHKFADNMTFVGLIQLDGHTIESDTLEVGAFCNGEERGSSRALYLKSIDAYRLFLTVQGQDGDTLIFRLYDHKRGKERRIRSRQMELFRADNHYGSIDRPYPFAFNTDYDKLIEAEICEGEYYVDNGFRVYKEGTYFRECPNDSIIRLDLTVNPVYHVEKELVASEFPMVYEGITFNEPGQYTLPFETAELCDSVLVITVRPFDGKRELLISPVPASRNQRVTLFFPFTADEQHDLMVEVYTMAGNLVQAVRPTRYPIELQPFVAAGTYMVRITMGTGEVLSGKFVVK